MINYFFRYFGINNILTVEKDDLFILQEKINEIGLIENDFSEDKSNENNNIDIQDISDSEEGSSDLEINSEEEEK